MTSTSNGTVIAKIAAVIAGVGLVATSFAFAAQPTHAQTSTEAALQAQIAALMAQVAMLQAQLSGGATAQFTMDLTIGASGAEVTRLQTWLIGKGFSIPAGATGYFGTQTRAAVAAYQAANGITPAAGYFGPITRARVNATLGTGTGTGTGSGTGSGTSTTLQGGEGSLDNFDTLGDVESTVEEGDEDVQVLGVEFDAEDADLMVERVDVEFFNQSGSGSSQLDNYIDSVSLWMDGKKIATADVDEADEDDDVYSLRFTGLKGIIREDDTANLYVAVDAVSNIDSDDAGSTWDVRIPADGIRAVDAAGISETYDSGALTETGISFEEQSGGDLTITEGDANPEASVVQIDEDDDTNGVTILAFDLEADNQDITVNDIPVGVVTSENEGVDGPVRRLMLEADGKVIDTVTVSGAAGTSYQALFEDLDYTIEEGETVEFEVVADLNDADATTFAVGSTLYATTTGSNAAWDAEDEEGDEISVDGSVTGEQLTFYQDTIAATLVSTSRSKSFSADETGEKDIGNYEITFKVKAVGADMYIDRSVTADPDRNGIGASGSGFQWATTSDSTTGTVVAATISASDSESGDTATVYKINEGDERTFTLSVDLEATQDGAAAVQLTGINWSTSSTVTTDFYTANLDNFRTTLQTLLVI